LATFLEPRVGAKPTVSGDTLEVEDGSTREGVRPRHVKTYIKRFMYMKGVKKNHRVFVSGKELTIQETELGEEEEEKEEKGKGKGKGGEEMEGREEEKGKEEAEKIPSKEEGSGQKSRQPAAEKLTKEPKSEKKVAAKKTRAKKAEPED